MRHHAAAAAQWRRGDTQGTAQPTSSLHEPHSPPAGDCWSSVLFTMRYSASVSVLCFCQN
ncbi:hypothetical protein E2C01_008066 [Portunus trituberculatus]|uniref:Uncharacterized protein n=1 Tax=Portunus trituberculatus TaxID=210409 RepID=A0A5B7D0N0_PORTR|nr:hypothetical protein [Portunus trituberculatus]